MHIKLFSIGPVSFYSYGLMIALGIIAAVWAASVRAKNRGMDPDHIFNIALIGVIAGVIGAKLTYYVVELPAIIKDPSILLDFSNGFVLYGGVIIGILAAYVYCRIKKKPFMPYMDLAVPSIPLAQGFGRIGCFLAGCCYGKESHAWYAVTFPESGLAPSGVSLIPTQLISSIGDLLLAAFLFWYTRKGKKRMEGIPVILYLILYSVGRFFVEFLRNDPRGSVGPFSTSQFIAIFVVIFAVGWLIIMLKEKKANAIAEIEARVNAEMDRKEQVQEEQEKDLSALGNAFRAQEEVSGTAEEVASEAAETVDAASEAAEGVIEKAAEDAVEKTVVAESAEEPVKD